MKVIPNVLSIECLVPYKQYEINKYLGKVESKEGRQAGRKELL